MNTARFYSKVNPRALDPSLRAGQIVVVNSAIELEDGWDRGLPLEELQARARFELGSGEALAALASRITAAFCRGTTLTSPWLIGDPEQKRFLFRRFQASIIDMETAALARACERRGTQLCCVRVVSDESSDGFLSPWRYDPETRRIRKAVDLLASGGWARRFRTWRSRSAAARSALREFLSAYLPDLARCPHD